MLLLLRFVVKRLWMRPGQSVDLVNTGGDIDNRIKDSLRRMTNAALGRGTDGCFCEL